MKVLHIIPSYYPAIQLGGPIQSVHEINKALVKKGTPVHVFTLIAGLEISKEIKPNVWFEFDGVKVKYLDYVKITRYNYSFSFLLNVFKNIKNYDLVHLTGIWNFPILAGSLCSIFYNKPFIISPRGSLYEETVNLKRSRIKKIYLKLFSRFFLKKASVIHYTSKDEFEKVERFLQIGKKSTIIHNGIDLKTIFQMKNDELFESKFPELRDRKYILSLGRITKKKGFDLLIPAMKKIVENRKGIFLIIAGPDDEGYLNEVKKIINENNLERNIVFTGLIDGELKWSVYRHAEIFVLPSYSENFGNTVVEAMACGTPVVVTNKVGISRELQQNDSGIIVDTTVDSLCNGIHLLLTNKKLREKIINNSQAMIKQFFDIDCVASQMLDGYKQILNG